MKRRVIIRFPKSTLALFVVALVAVGHLAAGLVMPSPAAGPRDAFAPNFTSGSRVVIVPSPAAAPADAVPVEIQTAPHIPVGTPQMNVRGESRDDTARAARSL